MQTKHRIKNQSKAVRHRHKAYPNKSSTENIANAEVQAETYYFYDRITIKKIYLRRPWTMYAAEAKTGAKNDFH